MKTNHACAGALLAIAVSTAPLLADEPATTEMSAQLETVDPGHAKALSADELDLVRAGGTTIRIDFLILGTSQEIVVPADIVSALSLLGRDRCSSPETCIIPTAQFGPNRFVLGIEKTF